MSVAEGRHAQLLEAARALIREDGIEGLGLRKVARSMGIRAPSLYRYVQSKEALVVELQSESLRVAARWTQTYAEHFREAQTRKAARPLAAILGSVEGALQIPPEHAELLALSAGPREYLDGADALAVGKELESVLDGGRALVEQAIETGTLKDGDAHARTVQLWLLVQGTLGSAKFARILPGWPAPLAEARGAVRALLRGWGATASAIDAIVVPPTDALRNELLG